MGRLFLRAVALSYKVYSQRKHAVWLRNVSKLKVFPDTHFFPIIYTHSSDSFCPPTFISKLVLRFSTIQLCDHNIVCLKKKEAEVHILVLFKSDGHLKQDLNFFST